MVYPISRTRLSLTFEITIIMCCLWDFSMTNPPPPPSLILVGTLFAFIFGIFHFQSYSSPSDVVNKGGITFFRIIW